MLVPSDQQVFFTGTFFDSSIPPATETVAFSFQKRVMPRKTIKYVLTIIVIVFGALLIGYFVLNAVIRNQIRQKLTNLSSSLAIRFSKVHADIFSSTVSFDSLDIKFIPYYNRQQDIHHLSFSRASLNGISFLKFLFSKKLEARDLLLYEGNIQLDSFLIEKKDSAQSTVLREITWPFKKLYITNVELKRANISLHSENEERKFANAAVTVKGVSISKPGEPPSLNDVDLQLSDINFQSAAYQVHLSRLAASSSRKIMKIDSLHVSAGENQNDITIASIQMIGIDIMELLNEKVLSAKSLTIDEGKIALFRTAKSKIQVGPWDLKKISIANLNARNLSVRYKDRENECRFVAHVELNGVDIDPSFKMDKSTFGTVDGDISGFHYLGNNYRNVEIKKIKLDSEKKLIQVTDINIATLIGKYELGKRLGHQADWMQAHISKVDVLTPDFAKLLQQRLFADKIKIGESNAYIFRDRRLPRPEKKIPLPVDIIKTIPVDIRVKTCELVTFAVEYEEYPRSGYGKTGVLKIEKIKLTWSPLINHPRSSDPTYMTMTVTGAIMGSGTTHGIIMMPLQKDEPYFIRGAIERLELTKLNSSSENLGKIRIKSGFLDFLSFDFTMTGQRSTGKIIGAYHHLVIQQLKKNTEEKNVADFASFALRHAIIPPNKDASLPERKRTGKVDYQRDPTRMVSYYFLQSLLMGVKKSFTLGFLLPK